jgi:hypothetical protein
MNFFAIINAIRIKVKEWHLTNLILKNIFLKINYINNYKS